MPAKPGVPKRKRQFGGRAPLPKPNDTVVVEDRKPKGRPKSTVAPLKAMGAPVVPPPPVVPTSAAQEVMVIPPIPDSSEVGSSLMGLARSASYLLLDSNPKTRRLSQVLQDEAHSHLSFSQMCSIAGVTMDEAVDLYARVQKMAGQVKIYERLPRIMSGIAEDAVAEWLPCPRCQPDNFCGMCNDGKIRKDADPESRRIIVEMAGFGGQKGGPLVQIQNNTFTGAPADSLLKDLDAPQTIPRITTSTHKDVIDVDPIRVDA